MDTLIGRKVGMTQVFDAEGRQIPVTVLEVGPCTVIQRKTVEIDGYEAVQLGFGDRKESRLTKPLRGHFAKAGAPCRRILGEVRLDPAADGGVKPGDEVGVSLFDGVEFVDVTATSKGRGFQGVVKRHGMGGGRASHGGGNLRGPGAIGMKEWPARVLKGKRLPGHMGHRRVTVLNLKVVQVRGEDHALLVRGAVPGPNGGIIMVRKAIKKAAKAT
jgi:large subunit ribosomal protein L3